MLYCCEFTISACFIHITIGESQQIVNIYFTLDQRSNYQNKQKLATKEIGAQTRTMHVEYVRYHLYASAAASHLLCCTKIDMIKCDPS